jgi:uroporphyrinogen decarboxylase
MGYEDLFPPVDLDWHAKVRRRFGAAFVGGEFDHITVDPMMLSFAAVQCGFTVRDFYERPELGVHCLAHIYQLYDLLPVTHWIPSLPWLTDLGVELRTMEHIGPVPKAPIVSEPEDVDILRVPDVEEIREGWTYQHLTRAYDYTIEHLRKFHVPIAYGIELIGGAAELCGVDNYIMWTMVEKEAAHKLKDIYRETAVNGAVAIASNYCSAMVSSGAVLANNDIFPDEIIREFAAPNLRQYVEQSFKRGAGPQLFYHFCGNHETSYKVYREHMMLSPFTVVHIGYKGRDPFPSGLLKEEFGRLATIMGSVDTKLFVIPDPKAVYEQSRDQIISGRDSQCGYVLGTACEIPPYSFPANLQAMNQAAKDFGSRGMW